MKKRSKTKTGFRKPSEIKGMLRAVERQIATLPRLNAFGGSNIQDLLEHKKWAADLKAAVYGPVLLKSECNDDVWAWMTKSGKSELDGIPSRSSSG